MGAMFADDICNTFGGVKVVYLAVELRSMGQLIDGIAERFFLAQIKDGPSRRESGTFLLFVVALLLCSSAIGCEP